MRPEIKIRLDHSSDQFFPGDVLVCEYQIVMPGDNIASAVESSVLWVTSGKGEEDFGVHFFERRPKSMLNSRNLSQPHRISTVLPQTPLSYEGTIIQVRWSVRLRVFLAAEQYTKDYWFQLGETTKPLVEHQDTESAELSDESEHDAD